MTIITLMSLLLIVSSFVIIQSVSNQAVDDLKPYRHKHGPHRTNRDVQSCQHYKYGNRTHSKYLAHRGNSNDSPILKARHAILMPGEYMNQDITQIHISYIDDPLHTVSVYEPGHNGACRKGEGYRATVLESARNMGCLMAVNAGFFNTTSGACYGNIISNGRLVQDSEGVQNAHFGITADGYLFFGYLSEIDLVAQDFLQLVGGVIWILRDGEVYIDESLKIECSETEETGTLDDFASVLSARTIVGHDSDGRLIIAQVDGKTFKRGATLSSAAKILKDYGVINAINLDGGGSSTYVINNTLVNYPSDSCKDEEKFNCARKVSTILCVHERFCDPEDCSGHGDCVQGHCYCHDNWSGTRCDDLSCPAECSSHGICTSNGCDCFPGYKGGNCSNTCEEGWYGENCQYRCQCEHNATCDIISGTCLCPPGLTGHLCESECPLGYYGNVCDQECSCDDGCLCDPVTGSCNYNISEKLLEVGTCIARKIIHEEDGFLHIKEEYSMYLAAVICLSILSALSIMVNLGMLFLYLTKWRKPSRREKINKLRKTFAFHGVPSSAVSTSSEELETSFISEKKRQKQHLLSESES
ncbi:hypothetical protein ACJMK2_009914 [Sinanodonta woodiana]|uniref:EGF-like domain-containing protein n=1 Tax=Sinanodonta woodiana TaxID=1069815 RepID=A0ABD3VDQ0_SINWO